MNNDKVHNCSRLLLLLVIVPLADAVYADGNVVNKVYHPYVDALEKELEYRSIFQDHKPINGDSKQLHLLSLGRSIGDNWFAELNLAGAKNRHDRFDLNAYELELKWQLTEQGEYSADWGMLFEYERKPGQDYQEMVVGVLAEKELGRWSGTANLLFINERGDDTGDEFETAFAMQARYRKSRSFEPAMEFYVGQNSMAIGPAILGSALVGVRKSINWEAGLMFGVTNVSPDATLRLLLEFEF